MKKSLDVIYLCNALDDSTKRERMIDSDSPAASNKVFGLCRALQGAGEKAVILSMGRGRQKGTSTVDPAKKMDVQGLTVFYAKFRDSPIVTHLTSSVSLVLLLNQILKRAGNPRLIAYNRLWHYIPVILFARLRRIPCFLDLEDGDLTHMRGLRVGFLRWFYSVMCNQGALLACRALGEQVTQSNQMVCYGTAAIVESSKDWSQDVIQVLLGGTLSSDTGVRLFLDSLELLIREHPDLAGKVRFVVTGKGEMAEDVASFSDSVGRGWVEFRGVVSYSEYQQLLKESHIGLCLKLPSGEFHSTTFPSKVIELASNGLLLVSTSVSDVPELFSDHEAILIKDENPHHFAEAMAEVLCSPDRIRQLAMQGQDAAIRCCSVENVGRNLASFLSTEYVR